MQKMLKGGNKHAKVIVTLVRSCQKGHKNSITYFYFEQISIIPVVFLLVTYNKYTAQLREFYLFQYIIFMFQYIISGSEH